MSQIAVDPPRRHRLSVSDYYRMAEVGILRPDERVELIDGEIIDMAPPGSLHAGTVDQLLDRLRAAVGSTAIVRVQNPIALDRFSEPQPDLTLLQRRADFYKTNHPTAHDVLLVIEVADTSLRFDRDIKTALYARNGIPEVWLVDLRSQQVTRFRTPRHGTYAAIDRPRVDQPVDVGSLAGIAVDLSGIFSAE